MSALSIDPRSPAEALAEGFGQHVERWSLRLQADATIATLAAQAARAVSRATSDGHVCIGLADVAAGLSPMVEIGNLRRALRASGIVGSASLGDVLPLVLDADDRLYLQRYFDYEQRLAQRLMRAARAQPTQVDTDTRRRLRELFEPAAARTNQDGPDRQMRAAALALRQRLTIISGGPGTGKTTTVVNLLACLIAQDEDCRIALAAPTGKAAARLTEAIRARASHLPASLRDRLPTESFTVHRLLGVTPAALSTSGGFVHHAGHPLAIDALVVDEASMLDLALATRLFEAVPASARIVLLGDKDQLSAVESGAVFAQLSASQAMSDDCRRDLNAICGVDDDLSPSMADVATPLADHVVWFTQNYRFPSDSGIGRLAADINGNRAARAIAWLTQASDPAVRWLTNSTSDGSLDVATARLLQAGYADYLDHVARDPADRGAIMRAFGRFRALCAVREGPRGVNAINERLTRHARERLAPLLLSLAVDARSPWFPGRPVMVMRNDAVRRLFNGDIGITLPDADGTLRVWFPDADAPDGFRAVAPVRLPEHQTAFAMTVHKSQGSEFDEVLVLLPAQRSRVLSRELLYTAVTRAKERVSISASAEVLTAAIESPTRRDSGLPARLHEAARDASAIAAFD